MKSTKQIKTALISVFHKEKLDSIVHKLNELGVKIYSTGGTQAFIKNLGIEVVLVEELTGYPSILGGRVKTLHPKIFGGILARRNDEEDKTQLKNYEIPEIDLVIVDLYPFEETIKNTDKEAEIIEKIDIGGISLIRAAAKNFKDVLVVSSREQYGELLELFEKNGANTSYTNRKKFAAKAFEISSHYDTCIFNHFNKDNEIDVFKQSAKPAKKLRYGENPHQKGSFYGDISELFEQIQGKEISYNNLLDIEAAVNLIADFDETTFAVLKHNNACGLASDSSLLQAWKRALQGDPLSAFGGILITNTTLDAQTATEIDKLFFEVIIAPNYDVEALNILRKKKNRIILVQKKQLSTSQQFRSLLNGVLKQEKDNRTETAEDLQRLTQKAPSAKEIEDLIFANKIVKHSKSNAIVLVKNKQLVGSGVGMTSRIDALKHAINKAKEFKLSLEGAVMASDAFFPFADSVELAKRNGIASVIQPGGSRKDQDSIDYCNANDMSMVFTGTRHFKH